MKPKTKFGEKQNSQGQYIPKNTENSWLSFTRGSTALKERTIPSVSPGHFTWLHPGEMTAAEYMFLWTVIQASRWINQTIKPSDSSAQQKHTKSCLGEIIDKLSGVFCGFGQYGSLWIHDMFLLPAWVGRGNISWVIVPKHRRTSGRSFEDSLFWKANTDDFRREWIN